MDVSRLTTGESLSKAKEQSSVDETPQLQEKIVQRLRQKLLDLWSEQARPDYSTFSIEALQNESSNFWERWAKQTLNFINQFRLHPITQINHFMKSIRSIFSVLQTTQPPRYHLLGLDRVYIDFFHKFSKKRGNSFIFEIQADHEQDRDHEIYKKTYADIDALIHNIISSSLSLSQITLEDDLDSRSNQLVSQWCRKLASSEQHSVSAGQFWNEFKKVSVRYLLENWGCQPEEVTLDLETRWLVNWIDVMISLQDSRKRFREAHEVFIFVCSRSLLTDPHPELFRSFKDTVTSPTMINFWNGSTYFIHYLADYLTKKFFKAQPPRTSFQIKRSVLNRKVAFIDGELNELWKSLAKSEKNEPSTTNFWELLQDTTNILMEQFFWPKAGFSFNKFRVENLRREVLDLRRCYSYDLSSIDPDEIFACPYVGSLHVPKSLPEEERPKLVPHLCNHAEEVAGDFRRSMIEELAKTLDYRLDQAELPQTNRLQNLLLEKWADLASDHTEAKSPSEDGFWDNWKLVTLRFITEHKRLFLKPSIIDVPLRWLCRQLDFVQELYSCDNGKHEHHHYFIFYWTKTLSGRSFDVIQEQHSEILTCHTEIGKIVKYLAKELLEDTIRSFLDRDRPEVLTKETLLGVWKGLASEARERDEPSESFWPRWKKATQEVFQTFAHPISESLIQRHSENLKNRLSSLMHRKSCHVSWPHHLFIQGLLHFSGFHQRCCFCDAHRLISNFAFKMLRFPELTRRKAKQHGLEPLVYDLKEDMAILDNDWLRFDEDGKQAWFIPETQNAVLTRKYACSFENRTCRSLKNLKHLRANTEESAEKCTWSVDFNRPTPNFLSCSPLEPVDAVNTSRHRLKQAERIVEHLLAKRSQTSEGLPPLELLVLDAQNVPLQIMYEEYQKGRKLIKTYCLWSDALKYYGGAGASFWTDALRGCKDNYTISCFETNVEETIAKAITYKKIYRLAGLIYLAILSETTEEMSGLSHTEKRLLEMAFEPEKHGQEHEATELIDLDESLAQRLKQDFCDTYIHGKVESDLCKVLKRLGRTCRDGIFSLFFMSKRPALHTRLKEIMTKCYEETFKVLRDANFLREKIQKAVLKRRDGRGYVNALLRSEEAKRAVTCKSEGKKGKTPSIVFCADIQNKEACIEPCQWEAGQCSTVPESSARYILRLNSVATQNGNQTPLLQCSSRTPQSWKMKSLFGIRGKERDFVTLKLGEWMEDLYLSSSDQLVKSYKDLKTIVDFIKSQGVSDRTLKQAITIAKTLYWFSNNRYCKEQNKDKDIQSLRISQLVPVINRTRPPNFVLAKIINAIKECTVCQMSERKLKRGDHMGKEESARAGAGIESTQPFLKLVPAGRSSVDIKDVPSNMSYNKDAPGFPIQCTTDEDPLLALLSTPLRSISIESSVEPTVKSTQTP